METGTLSQLIDKALLNQPQEIRNYIGASSIGGACERAIWYQYNQISKEPISNKQQRTLVIGKRLESIVLDCLEQAGVKLTRTWYDLQDCDIDEFKGHVDGVWLNEDDSPGAIIEVKTARDSSFKIFVQRGLKYWYPIYYAQLQAYMGMSGIHEAYLIALNKDTSELHDEHVLFDRVYYDDLKFKVKRILDAKDPLPKISNSPLFYVCRSCSFNKTCHS